MNDDQNQIQSIDEANAIASYINYSYYFNKGGQVIHDYSLPGNYVHQWEEYYDTNGMTQICVDWAGDSTYNLFEFSKLIVLTIAGSKIPDIGLMLAGEAATSYLGNWITYTNLLNIRNYGYGENITISDYNGTSSAWMYWTTYPYAQGQTEYIRSSIAF